MLDTAKLAIISRSRRRWLWLWRWRWVTHRCCSCPLSSDAVTSMITPPNAALRTAGGVIGLALGEHFPTLSMATTSNSTSSSSPFVAGSAAGSGSGSRAIDIVASVPSPTPVSTAEVSIEPKQAWQNPGDSCTWYAGGVCYAPRSCSDCINVNVQNDAVRVVAWSSRQLVITSDWLTGLDAFSLSLPVCG